MGETVVTIAAGSYSIEIWCTKLDHNLDKPITIFPIPTQKAQMDAETEPETYIIDIGRVKELITFQGFLIDESSESAHTKKANLLKIVKHKRNVTITWGTGSRQQSYSGNIQKTMITETPGIVGIQESGYASEKNFAIQLSLIVGTDK